MLVDTPGSGKKILIVEDDERLRDMLRHGLEEEGYDVSGAGDGDAGLRSALHRRFDCILLDIMLPRRDGLTVCRDLRSRGLTTPIIALTVKNAIEDRIRGLEAGADDYLTKPFSFEELLARIQAQIRRYRTYAGSKIRYADLEIDPVLRTAHRGGRIIDLTPRQFELLEYLMRNPGRVLSGAELIEKVWGLGFDPKTNVVNVYMHHLRGKIDRGFEPPLLHTIRGRGYVFGERPL